MKFPHLFEFMDLTWLPRSLRDTLREILECGNGWPFRSYYDWVCDRVLEVSTAAGINTIVELGAGTAPLTRRLAEDDRARPFTLVACDLNPDIQAYADLARKFPQRVSPLYEPVDFSRPRKWPQRTLLVLSATLHHVAPEARAAVASAFTEGADRVLVFEPLRKHPASLLFVLGSLVPALVLPLWLLPRPGRFRRFAWCWLLPVAPLMFLWDGWVSCLRQWTKGEWLKALALSGCRARSSQIANTLFCQMVFLAAQNRPAVASDSLGQVTAQSPQPTVCGA